MNALERSELQAIDAALAGEVVASEHERLADLARALRSMRARPSAQFAGVLDARAASGFPRRRDRRRPAPARARWVPAAGATVLAVAAVGLAVALSGTTGAHRVPASGSSVVVPGSRRALQSGPASAAPQARANFGESQPVTAAQEAQVKGGEAPARQIEHGSSLDVGVAPGAIQSSAQRVFSIAASYGGYVTQSNVSSGSVGQSYASFQLRLPSGRLAGAIAALSHLGRVRSENDTTNDVSGEDESLTRSLGDERAERAGLLRQIAKATEAAELAELHARLHAVEGRIGATEGSLHALQQRVSYSPLALSLTAETAAGGSTSGSSLTPGSALGVAGHILATGLAVLVIALAAALPLGLAVLAGGAAVSRSRRHVRERALDAG
jgi:Domain of unknown function (DUF4349)